MLPHLHQLTSLELDDAENFTPVDFEHLSLCSQLQTLMVFRCACAEALWENISRLAALEFLQLIDIANLTDAALHNTLLPLSCLCGLTIEDCPRVTAAGVCAALRAPVSASLCSLRWFGASANDLLMVQQQYPAISIDN